MITVRKTPNHSLILKLNKQIFPEDPLRLGNGSHCWILKENDLPVGFATGKGLTYEPDVVYLDRAGLKPRMRGQGLHRRLIKVRLRYFTQLGFRAAITYCLDDNLASANNLTACGFKLYEPHNRWADDENKKEVLYFMKEL